MELLPLAILQGFSLSSWSLQQPPSHCASHSGRTRSETGGKSARTCLPGAVTMQHHSGLLCMRESDILLIDETCGSSCHFFSVVFPEL